MTISCTLLLALLPAPQNPWTASAVDSLLGASTGVTARVGSAVAIDGERAVIGGPGHELPGMNAAGAAWVFERDAGSGDWLEVAMLTASDAQAGGRFGTSVALDGDTVVVGAEAASGAAYVFDRDQGGAGAWGESAKLVASVFEPGGRFGRSVAVSGDTVAAGDDAAGNRHGAVYVYDRDLGGSGAWGERARLTSSDSQAFDQFGIGLALEGDLLVIGADRDVLEPGGPGSVLGQGSAYVFARDFGGPDAWGETAKLASSNPSAAHGFGYRVSLSGTTLLVGEPFSDAVALNSGSVHVFERQGVGAWTPGPVLTPSDPEGSGRFGVALFHEGDVAAVGTGAGKETVYLLVRDWGGEDAWGEAAKIVGPNGTNWYGTQVASSGTRALIGAPELTGGTFVGAVRALAYDPNTDTVYGIDEDTDSLFTADPATGTATFVGPTGYGDVEGMAFDRNTNTLYASDNDTNLIVVLDPATGAGTPLGPTGFVGNRNVKALAFDPVGGILYGALRNGATPSDLVTIDTATGTATIVGPIKSATQTFRSVRALAFDEDTGGLWGLDAFSDRMLAIDPATGAATQVTNSSMPGIPALADQAGADNVYGARTSDGELVSFVATTAQAVTIGPFATLGPQGAVQVVELGHGGEPYCTAGVSASGCAAAISVSGTASATASSGFALSASGVEGAKSGLFFFGANGRQANSWGSGTSYQCVVPPVFRAGLLAGIGTPGACDGAFVQDLNALWCAGCPKPAKNPGAGAMLQAQLWYRDPLNTSNQSTSLSDAIETFVGP